MKQPKKIHSPQGPYKLTYHLYNKELKIDGWYTINELMEMEITKKNKLKFCTVKKRLRAAIESKSVFKTAWDCISFPPNYRPKKKTKPIKHNPINLWAPTSASAG